MNIKKNMRNKTAMVIGIFYETDLWVKHAKELGYQIIATHPMNINKKFYYNDIKDFIDKFYIVSYSDISTLIKIARENNVDMLIPHPTSNDATIASAIVNTRLGLKGVSERASLISSSKYDFHKLLEDNNLPRPKFTTTNILEATYPCIVKPNFGAGSVGVKLINNVHELIEFFDKKDESNGYNIKEKTDYYIIQEYVRGCKIMGCHSVVHNGELIIFGRTTRDLIKERDALPYFYGQEFITTREPIPLYTYNKIKKLIDVLGIDNVPFDLEVMLDENNNILSFVELNLRPAEKAFNFINGRDGYNYCIGEQVKLATNLPCDFTEKQMGVDTYIGIKYFKFKEGKIKNIKWPKLPKDTLFFDTKLKPGSFISPVWNVSTSIQNGSLIVMGKSENEIKNKFSSFVENIGVEYEYNM